MAARLRHAAASGTFIQYDNLKGDVDASDGGDDDGKPKSVRLVTRMHLPTIPRRSANYRALADLLDGNRRLLCVGVSPREVRQIARQMRATLPANTVGIVVQRWVGTAEAGRWEDLE
jgi:hypothetical protein